MSDVAYEQEAFRELIASLDPDGVTLLSEMEMGWEASEFLDSQVGRYLLGCAQQEYREASNKLKRCPFWRFRRIQQLQNEMWRAESFMVWLRDLIIRGRTAQGALESEE